MEVRQLLALFFAVAAAQFSFFGRRPPPPDPSPPSNSTCAALRAYRGPRVVAVGDVHGDFGQLAAVLARAGLADGGCAAWTGGATLLVQVGDVADRGPEVARANACLRNLQALAPRSGGRVVRLVGNHELLRAEGFYRDASPREPRKAETTQQWFAEARSGAVRGAFFQAPFLFSHAGFRPALLRRLDVADGAGLAAHVQGKLENALATCETRCHFTDDVFTAGADRGGDGVGGTFWTDWSILASARQRAMPDVVQIVGHSAAMCSGRDAGCELIRHRKDLRAIVIDAALSRAYGGNRAFLEVDEGALRAHSLRKGEWAYRDLAAACR